MDNEVMQEQRRRWTKHTCSSQWFVAGEIERWVVCRVALLRWVRYFHHFPFGSIRFRLWENQMLSWPFQPKRDWSIMLCVLTIFSVGDDMLPGQGSDHFDSSRSVIVHRCHNDHHSFLFHSDFFLSYHCRNCIDWCTSDLAFVVDVIQLRIHQRWWARSTKFSPAIQWR